MSDMEIRSVLSQMREIAQSGAMPSGPAASGAADGPRGTSQVENFSSVLEASIDRVNTLQSESRALAEQFEMGNKEVSLPQVMVALEKSSVSFEAVKQVRNKMVQAYQEIMNMQI